MTSQRDDLTSCENGRRTFEMVGKMVTSTTREKLPHLGSWVAHHRCLTFSRQCLQPESSFRLHRNVAYLILITESNLIC